jgi:hypothetical protein
VLMPRLQPRWKLLAQAQTKVCRRRP